MNRIKAVWTAKGVPAFPEKEIRQIRENVKTEYFDLCGSFYLFRYLHRVENADCTLLGDYCFGIFSSILAELDSVPLNDAFSDWLKKDTVGGRSFEQYLEFVKEHCGEEKTSVKERQWIKEILSVPGMDFAKDLIADTVRMEEMLLRICEDGGRHTEDLKRIVSAGGKRLRPMLAWTCWHLSGQKMPILPLMCMLELMHTSSLIHDDFVDEAPKRRGAETISHRKGGIAAHECGDFLLAKAMEFLETYRGTGINEALSVTAQEMCLGELDQRAGLYRIRGLTKQQYELRIRRKTAFLMSESCRCGAVAGGADPAETSALKNFGMNLGMAFQIRDDLLDWEPDQDTGKAPLADIKDGVMTLPVLLLKQDDELIRQLEQKEKTESGLAGIVKRVRSEGTLAGTAKELEKYADRAKTSLIPVRDCPEKKALEMISGLLTVSG